MTPEYSPDEVRRYDLMKLGVLLLLLVLLFLAWVVTRAGAPPGGVVAPESTVSAETGGAAGGVESLPAPTLVAPALVAPSGPLLPGLITLSGTAGPRARVAVVGDDQPLGTTSADSAGNWSLQVALPSGVYAIVVQTLDNVGAVVSESAPLTLTVGGAAAGATPAPTGPLGQPSFDPVGGVWQLGGLVGPNETVTVLSNGAPVGTATADASGAWALPVPAAAVTGDLVVETTDAAGTTTRSEPVSPGPRPASLTTPGGGVPSSSGATAVAIPAGGFTWAGQGAPETRVEVVVDGQPVGTTVVDAAGNWSLATDLPAGEYAVQLNSYDAAGDLLSSGRPFVVVAGVAGVTAEAAATPDNSLAGLLAATPGLASFRAALDAAGLLPGLSGAETYTLFAPNDDAFAAIPQGIRDRLSANPQALATILQYHMMRGRYTAAELAVVQPSTVNGPPLTIVPQGQGLTVNGANVLVADVAAANGLIHVIDSLLLPPPAGGVRPPVIDASGAATFVGPSLTVVGTGEPGRTIIVSLSGQAFGAPAVVDAGGRWQVAGDVAPGEYRLVAFMLNGETLEAASAVVQLTAR